MSWVVVVGDDEVSRRQLEVCRTLRPPEVRGAIRCDDLDNHLHPVCTSLPQFPAFCDATTNACAPAGLRETAADFAALTPAAAGGGTPSRTTAPGPPR